MTSKKSPGPRPPEHLSRAARRWWRQILAAYELEPHHLRLLQLACESWDRGQEARTIIAKEGLMTTDRYDRPKLHPAATLERDSRLAFARLVRELDLDGEPPPEGRPPRTRSYA